MGIWYLGRFIALFKSLGSIHNRSLLGFKIATMLLIHGVGFSTFVIIPCLVSSVNFCFNNSFIATGTLRETCCIGTTELSISMWYSSPRVPNPLNTSPYWSISLVLVTLHTV